MTKTQYFFLAGAAILQMGMYVGMGYLPKEKKYSSVAIALAEAKKKDEKKEKPKPPPPKPPDQKAAKSTIPTQPKVESLDPKAEQTPPKTNAPMGDNMEGYGDLNLGEFGNGGGTLSVPGGGGGGGGGGGQPPPPKPPPKPKALAASDPGCTEDVVFEKVPTHIVKGIYTREAQQANIEGSVRLELTIDASGNVTNVKVLSGLGFGLDEAAVAAAKQWTYKPATKCGKPVPYVAKARLSFGLK